MAVLCIEQLHQVVLQLAQLGVLRSHFFAIIKDHNIPEDACQRSDFNVCRYGLKYSNRTYTCKLIL